jgi:8-oxo-dGTP diphosphatase
MRHVLSLCVASFILRQGQVLILRRRRTEGTFPGLWEIPGGRVRPGEKLLDACIRETFEETGIRVRRGDPVSIMEYWKQGPHTRIHCVQINFLCRLSARKPTVQLSSEHEDYQWVPWNSYGKGLVSQELRDAWTASAERVRRTSVPARSIPRD